MTLRTELETGRYGARSLGAHTKRLEDGSDVLYNIIRLESEDILHFLAEHDETQKIVACYSLYRDYGMIPANIPVNGSPKITCDLLVADGNEFDNTWVSRWMLDRVKESHRMRGLGGRLLNEFFDELRDDSGLEQFAGYIHIARTPHDFIKDMFLDNGYEYRELPYPKSRHAMFMRI